MAQRQVYGLIPGTNRMGWHYVDLGPMGASFGHGRPVVHTFVPSSSSAGASPNGGVQQSRLKDAA